MSKKIEAYIAAIVKIKVLELAVTIDHSKYTRSDKESMHDRLDKIFDEIVTDAGNSSISNQRFRRQYRMRQNR